MLQAVVHILICSFGKLLSKQVLVERPIALLHHWLFHLWYHLLISVLLLLWWLFQVPFADLLPLQVLVQVFTRIATGRQDGSY
jgi:hypothetical protein